MPQQTARCRIVQLLCVLVSIALIGTMPAVADEVPGNDGGTTSDCADHEAASDAIDAVDTVEGSRLIDSVAAELDVLSQIQAILVELNYDLTHTQCPTEE